MAFVLPAGDYEAALRMAGASNFMEALESGVDRQLRRRANRQQMSQSRDLYNRQKALESANLLGEELAGAYGGAAGGGRGGGGAAGIPRMGAAQAILSDVEAYQRSLDEETAVQAQIDRRLRARGLFDEGMRLQEEGDFEKSALRFEEANALVPHEHASHNAALSRRLAGTHAPTPAPTIHPSVKAALAGALSARPAPAPVAAPTSVSLETVGDPNLAAAVDQAVRTRRDPFARAGALARVRQEEEEERARQQRWADAEQARAVEKEKKRAEGARADADLESFVSASRQEFPTKTRGEPVFLPGDKEALAAINARERMGTATTDDLIDRRAIIQRQTGLPEGESWIDPEAAKAGQLNELISAATKGTPIPSWATADNLADAADIAKEIFTSTEVSDVLSREAMLRAKDSPPLDARPVGGGGVSPIGALGPSLLTLGQGPLGAAIGQLVGGPLGVAAGAGPSPEVPSERHVEVGARIASKVPDDQLEEAIDALSSARTKKYLEGKAGSLTPRARRLLDKVLPGLSDLSSTGETVGGPRRNALNSALAELEKRQEKVALAGPEVEVVEEPVQIGTYTVKKGDYLHKVSSSYGVKLKALVEANRELLYPGGVARSVTSKGGKVLSGQDLIYPGDELRIPTGDGRETGGEAGPVDSREGAEKGVLAKAEGESDTLKELRAKLLKIQEGRPDKPVNPFQKFGRDIAFLPSLRAVAFAVGRAEQGDFSMINQMAGRVVKNYELEGLFADYRDFATGARRRADEIYMDQALEQQTAEQAQKLAAINATQMMALTQFAEAGYEEDEAKIFAGFYANLYAEDPEQARAWSTTLNAMGNDRRAAEAKRIKYGNGVGGTGRGGRQYSDKEIGRVEARLDKAQGRLTTAISGLSRALAPNGVPLPIEEMRKRVEEDPSIAPHVENYERALDTYNRYKRELEMMNEANLPPEALDAYQVESGKIDYAHVAKAYFGDGTSWDEFEQKLTEDGFSQAAAAQLRAFFEAKDKGFYDQISVIGGEPPEEAPGSVAREDLEAELARPGLTSERRAEVDRLLRDDFPPTVSPMEASGAAPALLLKYTKADDAAQLLLYRAQKGEDITKSELRKAKDDLASVQVAMERLEKSKAWKKNPVWRSPGRQTRIIGHVLGGVRPAGMRPLGRIGEGSLRSDISNIETTLWQLDKISGR